ncbi:MAG: hypothetical protein ACK5FT_02515 [Sphingomonadales bacterium]|jgi:hypothetical protein
MRVLLVTIGTIASFALMHCKKDSANSKQSENYFYQNDLRKDAPNTYLRKEGYDSRRNIYYLSLTFATGAVVYDTINKRLTGYGEAVRFYFYSPKPSEVLTGDYIYQNPIDTSNLYYKIQHIEVYTNNYSFNYTTNQKGFFYNKPSVGNLNVTANGAEYTFTYNGKIGYSNGNIKQPVSISGKYKGKIIF